MLQLKLDDTIAAISTPSGNGGIAIIRISGKDAFFIADKMVCATKEGVLKHFVSKMGDHTIAHCYVVDEAAKEIVDECMVSKMNAPKTYTAEDTVEINCHGGFAAASKVLELAFKSGARAADPGEFTKRAFLNGRIDLSEAEGVMDMISAGTEAQRRAAVNHLSGRLSEKIEAICQRLIRAIAAIEVAFEYPEFEMDDEAGEDAQTAVENALNELDELAATYSMGRMLKEGIRAVLAGKPNAGKSSLMNNLAGFARSIVTSVPGTTRDTVDETIQIDGVPVILTDTAGIRETDDEVEKIGVLRAKESLSRADVLIYVADVTDNCSREEIEAVTDGITFDRDNMLVVLNKTDVAAEEDILRARSAFEGENVVETSQKTGFGVELVRDFIKNRCLNGKTLSADELIITDKRHKQAIDDARDFLRNAKDSLLMGVPLDLVTYDIRQCTETLGTIMGRNISEDVLDDIFSRFCVGK